MRDKINIKRKRWVGGSGRRGGGLKKKRKNKMRGRGIWEEGEERGVQKKGKKKGKRGRMKGRRKIGRGSREGGRGSG
jgi:hypothetical protein